jgi:hypothetical protein
MEKFRIVLEQVIDIAHVEWVPFWINYNKLKVNSGKNIGAEFIIIP